MKKFYVNQKWLSFGDKFDILDESGNPAYNVHEKLLSLGKQFTVYSKNNQKEAYIQQKLFKLLPKYELYMNEEIAATVSKKFTFLVSKYIITSRFGDYTIDGSVFSWNFDIIKNGNIVCNVHKNFTVFKDKYEITIHDDVNEVFILSLVIILDAIHHNNNRR